MRTSADEESGTMAENNPLTGYEPNIIDNYNISETTDIFIQSPPATAGPRNCMTRRSVTTPSAERSLYHCSLRSAKNHRAVDKLITLLKKACCPVSRRLSVMSEQGDLFSMSLDHKFQTSEKIHVATQKVSKSGSFWNDNKGENLADYRVEIEKTRVPSRL